MNNLFGNLNTNKSSQSGGILFTTTHSTIGANNTMPVPNNLKKGIFGNQGGNTNQTTLMSQNIGNNLFGGQNNNQQPYVNIFNNSGLSNNKQIGQQGKELSTPEKNNSNQGINQKGNLFNNQVGNNQISGTSIFGNQGNQQQGNLNFNHKQGTGLFNSITNSGITNSNFNSNNTNVNSIFIKNIESSNLEINFENKFFNINQNQQILNNQKGTYHKRFEPIIINEKTEKGNVTNFKLMIFNLDKSMEELRYEDLQLKKSGVVYNQPNTDFCLFQPNNKNNRGLESGVSNNINTNMKSAMVVKHSLSGDKQKNENLNNNQQLGGGMFAQNQQKGGGILAPNITTNQQQSREGLFSNNKITNSLFNLPENNQQQTLNTTNSPLYTNTSSLFNNLKTNNLLSKIFKQNQPNSIFNTLNHNSIVEEINKINITSNPTTSIFNNSTYTHPQLSLTIRYTQQGGVRSNLFNNPTTNNPVSNPTTSLFTHVNKLQTQSIFPTLNPQENKTSFFSQPSSSLSSGSFMNINTMSQFERKILIDLTPEEIKNELEISSLEYRKRLNECISKLKIKYDNSDIQKISDFMIYDIYYKLSKLNIDSEIKLFEIQNQLINQSINEINNNEYDSEMNNDTLRKILTKSRKIITEQNTLIDNSRNKKILNNAENNESNTNDIKIPNLSQISNLINPIETSICNNLSTIINKTINVSDPLIQIKNKENNLININANTNIFIKFNCGACLKNEYFSHNKIELLSCGCTYCKDCLKDFFIHAETDFSLMPPRCHVKNIKLDVLDIIMTSSEKTKFMKKLEEFECPDKFYCQNNKCSQFINLSIVKINPFMCNKCLTYNCINCKTLWHKEVTCEKNKLTAKNDNIILDKIKLENNWKSCPKCKTIIELSSGCNHMTCRMCTYEFCYICLEIWSGLRCKSGCELYSGKNLDVSMNEEVRRLGLNPLNLQVEDLNRIRNGIRNRDECLHIRATKRGINKISNCVNCNYTLYIYCFMCDLCNAKVCRTCHYHRLRKIY